MNKKLCGGLFLAGLVTSLCIAGGHAIQHPQATGTFLGPFLICLAASIAITAFITLVEAA